MRTAGQRRARFLRIEKAVSLGDKDLGFPDIDNSAFGRVNFMREILGYVPIEPDGSVQVRVPANVAFVISILDADGRRLFPLHRNWLQVRPGETRRCNGCHLAGSGTTPDLSHGRDGTSDSIWNGATVTGVPFPGTEARFSPNAGETMAQVRARITCVTGSVCSALPSVDVVYTDEWTEPTTAGRAKDTAFSYTYGGAGGLTTAAPTSPGCQAAWNSTCRIVINYVQHIHPLWKVDRMANTCINCHAPKDAANAAKVPDGQLDLTDGPSNDEPLQENAFRELLFNDNEQEVNMGVLQDRLVPVPVIDPVTGLQAIDPVTGLPVTTLVPVTVSPSLAAGNARGSIRFFSRFAPGGSHAGRLTPAELRLISEWVDIGAQYFNNPFDPAVPLN
jgi:hypothetical protein